MKTPIHFKKQRTIRRDLILILFIGLVLPIFLVFVFYVHDMKTTINNKVISYQKVTVSQASDNLKNIFTSVQIVQRAAISTIISSSSVILADNIRNPDRLIKRKALIEHLNNLENTNPYVNAIFIISDSGQDILSSRTGLYENVLLRKGWIDHAWKSRGEEMYTGIHWADYYAEIKGMDFDQVFTFIQKIKLPEEKENYLLVQIDINLTEIRKIFSVLEDQEQMPMALFYPNKNLVVLANDIYQTYISQEEKIESIIIKEIRPEYISLKALIQKDQITNVIYSSIIKTLIILLLISVAGFFTSFFLSRRISTPLHQLYICMKKLGQGDFLLDYPQTEYREIQYLINRFQIMVNEIDKLIEEVVSKENETIEAELHALQAKINPHFLYNTLDVIRGMAIKNKDTKIADMTLSLSRLFRYNISQLNETTTIKDEIKNLKDYIKIQSYRFGERIKVTMEIDEELNQYQIIRFILQPLIENAYKHGLELKGGGGLLIIKTRKNDRDLIISIEDNGAGISAHRLLDLQNVLHADPDIEIVKKAHGMENVNLRIKLIYGKKYGIDLDSIKNEWTRVKITLPLDKE